MVESGLIVDTELPFSWQVGTLSPAQQQADRLLMRVVNLIDVHEPEKNKTSERIEAKLDLMLHWLGWQLFSTANDQPGTQLRLSHGSVEWDAHTGEDIAGQVILNLAIHPSVPAPLRLTAWVEGRRENRIHARLSFPDEEFVEAWNQWLFRLHRRAIQEARLKSGNH
jgi:hypothetical protein